MQGNSGFLKPTRVGLAFLAFLGIAALWTAGPAAAVAEPDMQIDKMKRMSLEELMDIEVTLVSMRPEKLSEAASAVQVITREDIRRSGAVTLPEALRLAANLQVAQVDAKEWAISARGFNGVAANKLLVMIDGRTVYTPLYSGVFWDAQHVLLEDIDRIEVISGPGATLWGSNAVNGVINIVTRDAADSQGAYGAVGSGTLIHDLLQGRIGGTLGQGANYRVYGQRLGRAGSVFADEREAKNASGVFQGGFRIDWRRSEAERITLQGDAYDARFGEKAVAQTASTGENVLGRWTRTLTPESEIQAQVYFDHTWRKASITPALAFSDELQTYDAEIHYRFPLPGRQSILLGAGYRLLQDYSGNFALLAFLPARKEMHRTNAFIQDEISILPDRLRFTLGTKVEYEEFDGANLQPSARLAWTPNGQHTLWGAVSRAVRTPSRIDVEFYVPRPPATPPPPGSPKVARFEGSPEFGSEKVIAYEAGYRVQPREGFSLSLAAFYNQYSDMRSVEVPVLDSANPRFLVVEFRNGLQGDSRGLELSGRFQPWTRWTLRTGYTYLEKDIWLKDPAIPDFTNPRGEWSDPSHQFTLQSMVDLPAGFQINLFGYYVDDLALPKVQSRIAYDAGVTWVYRNLEFSINGRNLADDQDPEFAVKDRIVQEIPRSVYGKIAWRL
jgi:iron complex outermembrane recepter protein